MSWGSVPTSGLSLRSPAPAEGQREREGGGSMGEQAQHARMQGGICREGEGAVCGFVRG